MDFQTGSGFSAKKRVGRALKPVSADFDRGF
jgi:hypothetical protein